MLAGHANNTEGTDDDFALLRYNTDGNLDTTVGTGGKLTTHFFASPNDNQEQAESVAIQADGKIIAADWTINPHVGGISTPIWSRAGCEGSFADESAPTKKPSDPDIRYQIQSSGSSRLDLKQ